MADYKDKFTLFWSREDFDSSTNEGFLPEGELFRVRLDGAEHVYKPNDTRMRHGLQVHEPVVAVHRHPHRGLSPSRLHTENNDRGVRVSCRVSIPRVSERLTRHFLGLLERIVDRPEEEDRVKL